MDRIVPSVYFIPYRVAANYSDLGRASEADQGSQ